MSPQRGYLLLPVALALAVTGALAYAMTREGSINVNAVDVEYDTDVARYLAGAALNLARWQNERLGCASAAGFGTLRFGGGTITTNDVHAVSNGISIDVSGTSANGALRRLVRPAVVLHDRTARTELVMGAAGGSDTFIRDGSGTQGGSTYLELTDGQANGLISFSMSGLPSSAQVVRAELSLYQFDSKSSQATRSLALHRVLRDWSAGSATWISPWSAAGGDYAPEPAASVPIAGNQQYTLRIDALVDGWAQQVLPNYGLLLKPTGLLEARFASFENAANRPQLVTDYYPRCK